jgi:hypothetical protein
LDLTGEQTVTCAGAKAIAAFLQVECGLREIVLRHTSIADAGAAALGAALGVSSVRELDLGQCSITNAGVRLLARALKAHEPPPRLETLLLDGNAFGDDGAVELIALLESSKSRPPALRTLSVQPATSEFSAEAEAALLVVCSQCHVELRMPRANRAGPMTAPTTPSRATAAFAKPARAVLPLATAPATPMYTTLRTPTALPMQLPTPPSTAKVGGHLAAWMADIERELGELRCAVSTSIARMDDRHSHLVDELRQLKCALDDEDGIAFHSDSSTAVA